MNKEFVSCNEVKGYPPLNRPTENENIWQKVVDYLFIGVEFMYPYQSMWVVRIFYLLIKKEVFVCTDTKN